MSLRAIRGDPSMVGALLDQIPGSIVSVLADGACDGAPVYRAIVTRQTQRPPAVIIPPRVTAVRSAVVGTPPSPRNQRIQAIQEKAVGYGKRSLVETAMFRYKTLIGPRLRARTLTTQKTETRVACSAINRMTQLGMPVS